jgi:hypothetical protein
MLQDMILKSMLDHLWRDYRRRVPYAEKYRQLVEEKGGEAINDHIALRTLNAPMPTQPSGIEAMRRIFLALGYTQEGTYDFPKKHLTAVHLEHRNILMPRIFISQLEVERLPADAAERIRKAVATSVPDWQPIDDVVAKIAASKLPEDQAGKAVEQFVHAFRRPWRPPLRETVLAVNKVSQYAAWTLLHGNGINHFTAFINEQNVEEWPDIETTIEGMRAAGIPLKDTIEGAPGSKLRQSSTLAAEGDWEVTEADGGRGTLHWTYAYYEIAERGLVKGPDGRDHMFTGFLGEQTPGLFEMTRMKQ